MSYDHWKTGGDNPGITDAQAESEAREAAEEAAVDHVLEPCERCGKRDLLTRLLVLVSPQTHESPAEYEELSLCMTCVPDDSNPREKGDDDGLEYGHPGDYRRGLE